mmetsp:Transcript_31164/g.50084  ORF Transcript_31164/g.50084 Transcript_31164/m.50084 type:complete len:237 (-) Transcript_31164:967-1677(-)
MPLIHNGFLLLSDPHLILIQLLHFLHQSLFLRLQVIQMRVFLVELFAQLIQILIFEPNRLLQRVFALLVFLNLVQLLINNDLLFLLLFFLQSHQLLLNLHPLVFLEQLTAFITQQYALLLDLQLNISDLRSHLLRSLFIRLYPRFLFLHLLLLPLQRHLLHILLSFRSIHTLLILQQRALLLTRRRLRLLQFLLGFLHHQVGPAQLGMRHSLLSLQLLPHRRNLVRFLSHIPLRRN